MCVTFGKSLNFSEPQFHQHEMRQSAWIIFSLLFSSILELCAPVRTSSSDPLRAHSWSVKDVKVGDRQSRDPPPTLEIHMLCKLNGKGLRFDILLREVDQYVCLCRSVCGAGEFWMLDKGIELGPSVSHVLSVSHRCVSDIGSEKREEHGLHIELLTKAGKSDPHSASQALTV